jgi:hypothetical protein
LIATVVIEALSALEVTVEIDPQEEISLAMTVPEVTAASVHVLINLSVTMT